MTNVIPEDEMQQLETYFKMFLEQYSVWVKRMNTEPTLVNLMIKVPPSSPILTTGTYLQYIFYIRQYLLMRVKPVPNQLMLVNVPLVTTSLFYHAICDNQPAFWLYRIEFLNAFMKILQLNEHQCSLMMQSTSNLKRELNDTSSVFGFCERVHGVLGTYTDYRIFSTAIESVLQAQMTYIDIDLKALFIMHYLKEMYGDFISRQLVRDKIEDLINKLYCKKEAELLNVKELLLQLADAFFEVDFAFDSFM